MVVTDLEPDSQTARVAPSLAEEAQCECGHPGPDHDRVARRFCAATVSGNLTRVCLCDPGSFRTGQQ